MHAVILEIKANNFQQKIRDGYWEVWVEQFGTDPNVKEVRDCDSGERFLVRVIC